MRFLPASEDDIQAMLQAIGVGRIEDLFHSIPKDLRSEAPLDLPTIVPEPELWRRYVERAGMNLSLKDHPCFLGAGAYAHHVPSVVAHLTGRSEFYTAYTPYQPEMAQGTLQAIFEYQTMMADLTAMDLSNASLYDGASAVAEAALMAHRIHGGKVVLAARSLHPAYREVLGTYLGHAGLDLEEIPFGPDGRLDTSEVAAAEEGVCAVLVQQPNFFGVVEDVAAVAASLGSGAKKPLLVTAVTEALSLALLEPPGALGADIVAGEARSFGLPLGYGGPYLGFLTTRKAFVRQLPGRIVGKTTDAEGRPGYVLTLSTREQHIRRGKATSNICSNQGLCALAAVIYLSLLGRKNLRELALRNLSKAEYLKGLLKELGIPALFSGPTFNEFAVKLPLPPALANERLAEAGMVGGYDLTGNYPGIEGGYLLSATETVSSAACDRLATILGDLS